MKYFTYILILTITSFLQADEIDTKELHKAITLNTDKNLYDSIFEKTLESFLPEEHRGKKEIIEKILECDLESLNKKNQRGETILIYATRYKKTNLAELLVKKGVDIHIQDNENKSALYYALITSQFTLAQILIDKSAQLTTKEYFALRKALDESDENHKLSVLTFFDFNHPVIEAEFHYAWENRFNKKSMSTIEDMTKIEHCFEATDEINKNRAYDLELYIICHDTETLNLKSKTSGETILHYSVKHGYIRAVLLLIQRKINLNILDDTDRSALYYALITKQFNLAGILIESNARITNNEYHLLRKELRGMSPTDQEQILWFFDNNHPWIKAEFSSQYDYE